MLLFFSKFSTENEEGEEDFSEEEGEQRKSTISLKKVQPCWFAIFLIKTNLKESSEESTLPTSILCEAKEAEKRLVFNISRRFP